MKYICEYTTLYKTAAAAAEYLINLLFILLLPPSSSSSSILLPFLLSCYSFCYHFSYHVITYNFYGHFVITVSFLLSFWL